MTAEEKLKDIMCYEPRRIIYVDEEFGDDLNWGSFEYPIKTTKGAEIRSCPKDCICVIPKDRRL